MVGPIFVAAIAGATLAFELVQTRVLSTLYYNHVVYVTVTIALMGFGISGVAISLLGRNLEERAPRLAAYCGAGFAISMFVCLSLARHLPTALPSLSPMAKLLLSYLILVVPFLFSGAALGLIFMSSGRRIHKLYAADLAASAAAALAFSLLLTPMGAAGFAWLCIAVAAAAFLLLAREVAVPHVVMLAVPVVLGAIAVASPSPLVGERPESYKTAGRFYQPEWTTNELLASRWTMTAKIDVWSDSARDLETGRSLENGAPYMMITQDNDAHTNMLGPDERERVFAQAQGDGNIEPLDIIYDLGQAPEDVLVIGAGGGKDVVIAHAYGAEAIDAVELNAATVDLVSDEFVDYAAWPEWENVELTVAEGRHFVRTGTSTYDLIIMSGVDTFAALSSGAYVLSENYLYTVESIRDYLGSLKPDGILGVHRWFFPQPRESLRLASLYVSAAEELGTPDPQNGIMVIAAESWATTLIKNGAFTPAEVETAIAQTEKNPRFGMVYVPKVFSADEQEAVEARAFADREEGLADARAAYADLMGAASDEERRQFEDDYVYNITPVRDDRPFFFEYFKGENPDQGGGGWAKGGVPEQLTALRGNAAHYMLHILIGLTALIGFFAMIVPLLIFNRQGVQIDHGFSLAAYFSALGIGFMLIEIGLMQKLTLYLGHPMYSVAVVLAGVLFFAGLGAFLSERLALSDERKITVGMLGTAALVLVWLVVGQHAFPATAGWPLLARIALCLATLAPLATVMGIPFATGLRYLERHHPAFIPWAWGVNGITSVLASVAAILIAMRAGFTIVLVVGAAVYGAGLLTFLFHRRVGTRAGRAQAA